MKIIVCKWMLMLTLIFSAHQADGQDTIQWRKNFKLSWSDFKGKPNSASKNRAVTSSGIAYSWSLPDTGAYFKTVAFFIPNKSWTKTSKDTNTLHHEQGHFDITEIYARRLLAAFQQLKQDGRTSENNITATAEKIIVQKNDYQKKYDVETHFGTNTKAQKIWEDLILAQLSE